MCVGYEWIAEQAFDANVKPYKQSNLEEKIYSERIFIEIIVIIVKEHLQRLCNKSFAYFVIDLLKRALLHIQN